MAKQVWYAVRKGRKPGIYTNWEETKRQVTGFANASFKKFESREQAQAFLSDGAFKDPEAACEEIRPPYAFVDGSYNSAKKIYGYGGFVFDGSVRHPVQGSGRDPQMASMRNVAGEIEGSMAAVRKAEELGLDQLTILYDYKGIEEWARHRWKTNREGTKAYAAFMNAPERTLSIRFVKVAAHTGIEGNEIADLMAKRAAGLPLTPAQAALLPG